jgi:2-methylisocitrate lyase-like PEP mutase family enzyme
MSVSQSEKAAKFDALYAGPGAFVIANVFDTELARIVLGHGFEAVATSSGGFVGSSGCRGGLISRDEGMNAFDFDFTLTGRWKNSLRSNSYLDNSICGLQAYEAGGESIDRAWIAGLGCSADIMRSCLQAVQLYGWSFREVIRLC